MCGFEVRVGRWWGDVTILLGGDFRLSSPPPLALSEARTLARVIVGAKEILIIVLVVKQRSSAARSQLLSSACVRVQKLAAPNRPASGRR